MVKISNVLKKTRKDGTTFILLELTGSVELIQSSESGNFYATVKKANVPCTFDEQLATSLIGQELKGNIVRIMSEPYKFLNKRTGEVMTLSHTYAYRPENSMEALGQGIVTEVFS